MFKFFVSKFNNMNF